MLSIVSRELASIHDRLVVSRSLEERAILHSRREELRAAPRDALRVSPDEPTLAQAHAQLAHLEDERVRLIEAHVPHANGAAFPPSDLDEIERGIVHLRDHLASIEAD